METLEKTSKTAPEAASKAEMQKGIDNHKKAAAHFESAAKSHLAAAKHHEDGHHEKAAKCTVDAHGHACMGKDAQTQDVKHHASMA
ncbi:MAG: hypothetical protein CFE24_14185 [Flavobacterium sp. BFFFF2]|nr:MAG: hypothetical protein CFE24_14185 [Flavobacterium sp. BFFFF2]